MKKRLLLGGALSGALVAAYLLGSLTVGVAGAQAPNTTQATVQQSSSQQAATQDQTSSNEQATVEDGASQANPENGSADGADPAPAGTAKITPDQAKAAALAQFPGATVNSVQPDDENGKLVYSVEVIANGTSQDVKVDAQTGKVLTAQPADSQQDQGTDFQG